MKVSQFVRVLKASKCQLIRSGKEHDMWFSPITGETEAIPRHGSKELGKGIERKLRRKSLRRLAAFSKWFFGLISELNTTIQYQQS